MRFHKTITRRDPGIDLIGHLPIKESLRSMFIYMASHTAPTVPVTVAPGRISQVWVPHNSPLWHVWDIHRSKNNLCFCAHPQTFLQCFFQMQRQNNGKDKIANGYSHTPRECRLWHQNLVLQDRRLATGDSVLKRHSETYSRKSDCHLPPLFPFTHDNMWAS